jgi:hypothetical protein
MHAFQLVFLGYHVKLCHDIHREACASTMGCVCGMCCFYAALCTSQGTSVCLDMSGQQQAMIMLAVHCV